MTDKDIEIRRYNDRAKFLLNSSESDYTHKTVAYLNVPYEYYFKLLDLKATEEGSVLSLLEIGAGMGENTKPLVDMSYNVCSTDISSNSIEVMSNKFSKYANFSTKVVDMEKLPFHDESFDVVCSAGSLSYGDNTIVMNEIYRVLKQKGVFIAVDSLNNNRVYRLNRYIHYLRGNRSKSTLSRMPTVGLLNKYAKKFGHAKVRYFGAITWAFPLLNKILPERMLTKFSNWIDAKFNIKESAFKFVIMATKK